MRNTQLRRRKDDMYGISLAPNQYAFFEDEDTFDLHACLYKDANFVAERAVMSAPSFYLRGGNNTAASCILSDSSGLVGDGSLIAYGDPDGIFVWDVAGDLTYSYAAVAGWVHGAAFYRGGFLWWIEATDTSAHTTETYEVRLRKATTDLATVTTVSTWTSPVTTTLPVYIVEGSHANWSPGQSAGCQLALTATSGIVFAQQKASNNINFEKSWILQFPLDGSSIVAHALPDDLDSEGVLLERNVITDGIGTPNGSLMPFWFLDEPGGYSSLQLVALQPDDPTTDSTVFWPISFLTSLPAYIDTNQPAYQGTFNLSPNGQKLQVSIFTFGDTNARHFYLRDSAVAVPGGSSAAVAFEPLDHPDFADSGIRTALFYFGE